MDLIYVYAGTYIFNPFPVLQKNVNNIPENSKTKVNKQKILIFKCRTYLKYKHGYTQVLAH